MKKLILSAISILMISFTAFSNPVKGGDKLMPSEKELIDRASVAVEYLQKELKLRDKDSKLKQLKEAYDQYARSIIDLNKKIESKNKHVQDDKKMMMQNKKMKFTMMNDMLEKRDKKISKFLSKKQFEKYRLLSKSIHPFSLKLKKDKAKEK